MLILKNGEYEIVVENDDTYATGSADNARFYDTEHSLDDEPFRPSSQHSVTVKSDECILGSCILLAGGGTSGVHEHSALLHGNSCIIAVGPFMCSLRLPSFELEWKAQVDMATCFGVYYSAKHDCFISHGELEISRIGHGGRVLWQAGGEDIFTNGFELLDNHIEVVDFNGRRYCMEIDTGVS